MIETTNITKERIKESLKEGKRFDGRKFDEYRKLVIESGVSKKAEGSVRVRLGETDVVVGIKMDVVAPYPDGLDEGVLMTSAEFLAISSPRYEPGPPKIGAIELARIIDRGIRESKYVDFKKLCIKEGEKVWQIFIDIYSINDDGNLLDAAAIGALAALKSAKIPKYDEKTERVQYGEWSDKKVPLVEKNTPFTITIHKIGDRLIVDPNREEEDASEGRISIAMSGDSSENFINAMQKGNVATFSIEELEKVLELVENQWKEIKGKFDKLIK